MCPIGYESYCWCNQHRDTEHWPWNETIQFCIHQVLIGRQIVAFVSQTTEKFSSNSEGGTEYYWCFKQLRFLQAKLFLYWNPQKPICHTTPHFLLTATNQLLRSWAWVFPFLEVFIPSASLFPKPFRKYKRFGFPLLKDIVVKPP